MLGIRHGILLYAFALDYQKLITRIGTGPHASVCGACPGAFIRSLAWPTMGRAPRFLGHIPPPAICPR
ncbi:hypothetical protein [Archangium sp.]|uniref:hypothetical protein n=1 Tax=Archangium sp. TaxID=1872627 RepID=UPI002D43AF05|nr:hypothetical protein [Archangium sp.]HYO51354.1 hypothetical protein [Archangium sp.]